MSLIDTDILKKEIYKLRDKQCDNLERNETINDVITVIDFLTGDITCSKCLNRDKSKIIQNDNICFKCEKYSNFIVELKGEQQ